MIDSKIKLEFNLVNSLINQTNAGPYITSLSKNLAKLESIAEKSIQNQIWIDVIVDDLNIFNSSILKVVAPLNNEYVEGENNLFFKFIDNKRAFNATLSNVNSNIGIYVNNVDSIEHINEIHLSLLEDKDLIIYYGNNECPTWLKRLTKAHIVEANFSDDFYILIEDKIGFKNIEIIQQISYLKSLEIIDNLLIENINIELGGANVKQIVSKQIANSVKLQSSKNNFTDISTKIKSNFNTFEIEVLKPLKSKFDEYNKNVTGEFSKTAEVLSKEFIEFDSEDTFEKADKTKIKIPEKFKEYILTNVEEICDSYSETETNKINESFSSLLKNNHSILSTVKLDSPSPKSLNIKDVKSKVIKPNLFFTKVFSGELIKKGMKGVWTELKDSISAVQMVSGLVMPFVIIISTMEAFNDDSKKVQNIKTEFYADSIKIENEAAKKISEIEEKKLSVEEKKDEIQREKEEKLSEKKSKGAIVEENASSFSIKKIILVIIALITSLALMYSGYELINILPRKRHEKYLAELDKAREMLNGDIKRCLSDFTKDYLSLIDSQWKIFKDNYLAELEANFKNEVSKKGNSLNDDANSATRQLEGIANQIKSLSSLLSPINNSKSNIITLKRDYLSKFQTEMKNNQSNKI